MSRAKKKKSAPASRTARKRRFDAPEAAGILILFAAVFLLVCVTSYDGKDPSWASATPDGTKVRNWGGAIGAWIAEALLQGFGLGAFLLPFLIGALGLRAILAGERKFIGRKAVLYLAGLAILLPLLHLVFQNIGWGGTRIPIGGLSGKLLVSLFHGFLGSTGTLIFLLAAASLYAVGATGFSFRKAFLAVGRMFIFAFRGVRIKVSEPARPERTPKEETAETVEAASAAELAALGKSAAVLPPEKPESKPGPRSKSGLKRGAKPPSVPVLSPPDREPPLFPEYEGRPVYDPPPLTLLDPGSPADEIDKNELLEKKRLIEEKLREFDVEGEVKEYHPGPVITTYEFYPKPGIKIAQVTNLAEDLSLALSAESVRIQRIPGKASLGVEIPNNKRETIKLRDILESPAFRESNSKLAFALGKTVHDEVYVTDLGTMPHLLVAGATGTGKSVCLNALIASILYKASPDEVKLILIDPKRLEFSLYDGIPHLFAPVINDPKKASVVLLDAVKKMEERYYLLQQHKVRNIEQYNFHVASILRDDKGRLTDEERAMLRPLPYIVIIIDELAELIMVCGQDVDFAIGRLAQLARAVGIHLVLATQRPSIDVITGTIKNNFASRIAFRVPSKIDSRVILDANGAEKLLGMGDMLFMPPNYPRLIRLHCSYVSIPEVRRLVNYVKKQGTPDYDERIVGFLQKTGGGEFGELGEKDELYENAVRLILNTGQASASYLQRKLKLGYARASRIIDQMEQEGLLGPSEGSKPREILVNIQDYLKEMGPGKPKPGSPPAEG
jgi:S-DNA-T family DNA segregation ATPase FtsK/SpoIIIE